MTAAAYDRPAEVELSAPSRPIDPAGARDATDLRAHNSPSLVRSPRDSRVLALASRVDSPTFSCMLRVSRDGGAEWRPVPIPAPRGEEPKCYAPDVAFSADGRLHLSFVTLRGRGNVPSAAWTARLTRGGRSLTTPRKALGPLAFQVRLAVDPRRPRRLYMTWLDAAGVGLFKFTSLGNPIRAMRSDDGGRTWSPPARVSAASRARVVAPQPAVGPRGELYVAYLDLRGDRLDYEGRHGGRGGPPHRGTWELVLARSRDGGTRWSELAMGRRLMPAERFVAFVPAFPSVVVAPDGTVHAAFDGLSGGDRDVLAWRLRPGAAQPEGPLRVNDTPSRDGTSQYLPKLALAPGGRLDVLYYDRRSDRANDRLTEASFQSSFDEGQTFGSRVRLSDRGFDSRVGFGAERGLADLGSRLGLISTDEGALAVWTDTRGGTPASRKQDLASAAVSVRGEAERWSAGALLVARVAGGLAGVAGLVLLAWTAARRLRPRSAA